MISRWRCTRMLAAALLCLALACVAGVAGVEAGAAPAAPAMSAASSATKRVLLWSDEFNAARVTKPNAAKWQTMTGGGGWGNNELESYTPQLINAFQQHGSLRIVARKQNYTGHDGIARSYTSARLMGLHPFKYGYLTARIMIPRGTGLWPAFWTLGSNIRSGTSWPMTGEIDVMESISKMSFVAGSLHGPDSAAQYWWQAYDISHQVTPSADWWKKWHTFGVYWTASAITWYLDGHPYATVRKSELAPNQKWVFDQPQVPLLNLAVGGNWPGSPDRSTAFPAVMKVDYVRLYNRPAA